MTNNEILQSLQTLNTLYIEYMLSQLEITKQTYRTPSMSNNINTIAVIRQKLEESHDAILKLYNNLEKREKQ